MYALCFFRRSHLRGALEIICVMTNTPRYGQVAFVAMLVWRWQLDKHFHKSMKNFVSFRCRVVEVFDLPESREKWFRPARIGKSIKQMKFCGPNRSQSQRPVIKSTKRCSNPFKCIKIEFRSAHTYIE